MLLLHPFKSVIKNIAAIRNFTMFIVHSKLRLKLRIVKYIYTKINVYI